MDGRRITISFKECDGRLSIGNVMNVADDRRQSADPGSTQASQNMPRGRSPREVSGTAAKRPKADANRPVLSARRTSRVPMHRFDGRQVNDFHDMLDALNEELRVEKAAHEVLRNEVAGLHEDINALSEELRTEKAAHAEAVQTHQNEKAALERLIDVLHADVEQHSESDAALRDQNLKLKEANASLIKDIGKVYTLAGYLRQDSSVNDEVTNTIADILESIAAVRLD